MPAADKQDSGVGENGAGGAGGIPPQAGPETPAPPASASPFVYDPLAPEPGSSDAPDTVATPDDAAGPVDESTVGTGTSIALGCIAGSVFLIIIAILILFLVSVFAR
ncbi:MAG: hypothetical protein ACTHMX_03170 [Thermomicrobiales bacterium]